MIALRKMKRNPFGGPGAAGADDMASLGQNPPELEDILDPTPEAAPSADAGGNLGGKALDAAGKATRATGKGIKTAGKSAEVAGKGMEMGSKAAEVGGQAAGQAASAAGTAMRSGGAALTKAGTALSGTGLGAIAGVPMAVAGAGMAAGGTGLEVGGKGVAAGSKAAGAAGRAAGKGLQSGGKSLGQAGSSLSKSGQTGTGRALSALGGKANLPSGPTLGQAKGAVKGELSGIAKGAASGSMISDATGGTTSSQVAAAATQAGKDLMSGDIKSVITAPEKLAAVAFRDSVVTPCIRTEMWADITLISLLLINLYWIASIGGVPGTAPLQPLDKMLVIAADIVVIFLIMIILGIITMFLCLADSSCGGQLAAMALS